MKIDKPTQIEPVKPSPRKLADKETQAESIKYYDIENACETPGEGFPGQLIRTDSKQRTTESMEPCGRCSQRACLSWTVRICRISRRRSRIKNKSGSKNTLLQTSF